MSFTERKQAGKKTGRARAETAPQAERLSADFSFGAADRVKQGSEDWL